MRNLFDPFHLLFDPPLRGPIHLVLVFLVAAASLFRRGGRYSFFSGHHPSVFDEFISGNPSDFAVLFSLGLLIWVGFAIAVTIEDYRNGHW